MGLHFALVTLVPFLLGSGNYFANLNVEQKLTWWYVLLFWCLYITAQFLFPFKGKSNTERFGVRERPILIPG